MLRRYAVADVAHRVVGVGSVGTRAYLALCFGNGDNDPLFLQVKEAIVPVHAAYLPPMICVKNSTRAGASSELSASFRRWATRCWATPRSTGAATSCGR